MKKLISVILCFATLLCVMTAGGVTASAKTHKSGSYKYVILKSGNVKITRYTGNKKKVVIPKKIKGRKVTVIGKKAFYGKKMKRLVLNKNIRKIEQWAFFKCKKLKRVTIPKSVKKIGSLAFGVYLNKNADFENVKGFYMRGYLDSAAQKYAYGFGDCGYDEIPFIALDYGVPQVSASVGKNEFSFSFTEVKDASYYEIKVFNENNLFSNYTVESTEKNKDAFSNVSAGTYTIKVRAIKKIYNTARSYYFPTEEIYSKWSTPVTIVVQ